MICFPEEIGGRVCSGATHDSIPVLLQPSLDRVRGGYLHMCLERKADLHLTQASGNHS